MTVEAFSKLRTWGRNRIKILSRGLGARIRLKFCATGCHRLGLGCSVEAGDSNYSIIKFRVPRGLKSHQTPAGRGRER